MEIAGIDVAQVVEVVVALAVTYLAARIVSRVLAKVFEKTPFPKEANIHQSLASGFAKFC